MLLRGIVAVGARTAVPGAGAATRRLIAPSARCRPRLDVSALPSIRTRFASSIVRYPSLCGPVWALQTARAPSALPADRSHRNHAAWQYQGRELFVDDLCRRSFRTGDAGKGLDGSEFGPRNDSGRGVPPGYARSRSAVAALFGAGVVIFATVGQARDRSVLCELGQGVTAAGTSLLAPESQNIFVAASDKVLADSASRPASTAPARRSALSWLGGTLSVFALPLPRFVLIIIRIAVLAFRFLPAILTLPAVLFGRRVVDDAARGFWTRQKAPLSEGREGGDIIELMEKESANISVKEADWWREFKQELDKELPGRETPDNSVARGEDDDAERLGERSGALWWYGVVVDCMESAGPTFIKLAQWASTREDLLPPSLTAALARLQADALPHSWEDTRLAVRDAFGMEVEEMFESMEKAPWGVGAIAQVHRAVLHPAHTPPSFSPTDPPMCAVKVLHPNVAQIISLDLSILHFFARVVSFLVPGAKWLALQDEVETFSKMMRAQVDLRGEARNLEDFRRKWEADRGKDSRKDVCFPVVVRPYVAEKVLVETYEVAIPLTQFMSGPRTPADHALARIGLDTLLTMLAVDNFVHVDMHPGNMLVTFRPPAVVNETSFFSRILPGSGSSSNDPAPKADGDDAAHQRNHRHIDIFRLKRLLMADPSDWPSIVGEFCRQGYRPHLVLLDCGLVSRLSAKDLRNFLDLFTAVVTGKGEEAGMLMIERSRNPDSCTDKAAFSRAISEILADARERTLALKDVGIGDILRRVFQAVRRYRVQFEGEFVNTVVSIVLVEGIGRRLDPEMDLLSFAARYLEKIEERIVEAGGRELEDASRRDVSRAKATLRAGSVYRNVNKAVGDTKGVDEGLMVEIVD